MGGKKSSKLGVVECDQPNQESSARGADKSPLLPKLKGRKNGITRSKVRRVSLPRPPSRRRVKSFISMEAFSIRSLVQCTVGARNSVGKARPPTRGFTTLPTRTRRLLKGDALPCSGQRSFVDSRARRGKSSKPSFRRTVELEQKRSENYRFVYAKGSTLTVMDYGPLRSVSRGPLSTEIRH